MLLERMCRGRNTASLHSMHSEVMAIQSALSLPPGTLSSQTSAHAAAYYQKLCFKLPDDYKKRKGRAQGLKIYAEAVCAQATPANTFTGKVGGGRNFVQKQGFEPGTSQPGQQVQPVQPVQRVRRQNEFYDVEGIISRTGSQVL
jgi:hypothetical protein